MGNRISAVQDPVIMTASYLEEKVIQNIVYMQDLDSAELHKLIKIDGLEYDIIFSLDLEHQSLVNIDDLWQFRFLTKLEMPNNFLERIEGLESLVNLRSLDLSFNYIKTISNLENLVNLLYLNLTSNEISVLENMDSLKQLRTFLVRYNKIKSFDNVCYLSEFKNITNLAIDKNPIMEDASMKYHILALLPQLKYLDFTVVTPDQLREALKKFPPKSEKNVLIHNVNEKFKCSFPDVDKEAYVEGLANGQGFQSFLLSDKNYALLHSFPLASHISEVHCSKVREIFDEWHDIGHKYYEEMQLEMSQFSSVLSKAKDYSLEVFREEEMKFISIKEQIPKNLCSIYQSDATEDEKDKNVNKLRKECDLYIQITFKNFMNTICLCVDLLSNTYKRYEKEISMLHTKYIQEVEKCMKSIMDINEVFADKLQEFYFNLSDSGYDISNEIKMEEGKLYEYDPAFLHLIKKKELIKMTMNLSLRFQSTMLNERIKDLKLSLHNDLIKTIDEAYERAFLNQGEKTRNTVIFCNKQKFFIEKLFSKNNIFKHYLGYR